MGRKNYIASLIGLNSAKDQPCAEWWLGAHPSAPSEIEDVTGKQSLIEFFIAKSDRTWTGKPSTIW